MPDKKTRKHSLRKGDLVSLVIDSLAPGGDGVGTCQGVTVFVARTAPGDRVEARLFDVRKDFARGSLEALLESGPERVEPVCPVFSTCGGCQWQHVSYAGQLESKVDIVRQALKRIGGIEPDLVEPCAGTSHHLRYRNKAQFPVAAGARGGLAAGYYERNSHTLVDIDGCPVVPEPLERALSEIKRALIRLRFSAYDETGHLGLLRHIVLRESTENKSILATLVLNAKSPGSLSGEERACLEQVASEVCARLPDLSGFCLNFNNARGNRILGETTVCIKGSPAVEEVLRTSREGRPERLRKGLAFQLSTGSFFQVHAGQAVFILDEIFDLVKGRGARLIIDAYAGVGVIAMWVAELAERILAVEENDRAVADGLATAAANRIENIEFKQGKAEVILPAMAAEGLRPDVIILDPPRKGAAPEVLEAAMRLVPELIIYVSCNPATLARDLKILSRGTGINWQEKQAHIGYKTQRVKPVDLFPQTYHVESIACLERIFHDGIVGNLEES